MKLIKYLLILTFVTLSIGNSYANINLTVSPIKYEIETATGNIIIKTATLFNRSNQTHTIITGKSDFESKDNTGNPSFIRKNEPIFSGQELSSWIEIDTEKFTIGPGEKKEINFTITVPDNATPGGHYGAIFFKNNNSKSGGGQININVDYGVLLLVKVDGEIITKANIEDTIITNTSTGYGWSSGLKKDECFILDLTISKYDKKCIDLYFLKNDIELKSAADEETKEKSNFNINFDTLFINQGNTHLKPSGKIKLINEEGKEIKGIGKEVIKNEVGAIIGEKIVDYLPINDNGGNVLPYTKRNFQSEWKGFPFETYDKNGKKIIKYWSPEEYYTQMNIGQKDYLMPWERFNERINHKVIKAHIDITYKNKDGEIVQFNSAKEFNVNYKDKYIGINPYVIILIGLFSLLFYLLWIIFKKKKHKCQYCKKRIDQDMIICPYCGKKQKNKIK